MILGSMGVGKTTTADAVAVALGRRRRDSDEDIERAEGRAGRDIADTDGVARLHELEAQALLDALADDEATVISAAASVVDHPECRTALRERAFVVVLELSTDRLVERIASGRHRRRIDRAELERLRRRRAPLYDDVADLVLDAAQPTDDLVAEIVAALST